MNKYLREVWKHIVSKKLNSSNSPRDRGMDYTHIRAFRFIYNLSSMSKIVKMEVIRTGGNWIPESLGALDCEITDKAFVLKWFYRGLFHIWWAPRTKDLKVLIWTSSAFGALKDWGDGTYTIYDRWSWTPYFFNPCKKWDTL
jgi:hypothetical protein